MYTSVLNRKRKSPVSSPRYALFCSTCRYNSVLHTAVFYAAHNVMISFPKPPTKYSERLRLSRQGWFSYDGLIAMLGDFSWEFWLWPPILPPTCIKPSHNPKWAVNRTEYKANSCTCLKFLRCWCITGDRAFALALAGPVLVLFFVRVFDGVFFLGLSCTFIRDDRYFEDQVWMTDYNILLHQDIGRR